MILKIITIMTMFIVIGCNSSSSSEEKVNELDVRENNFALQEYILVLDDAEKLKTIKKVLSQSYGELHRINGVYYRFRVVFLQSELKPFLMTQKDLEKYSSGK